MLRNIIKYTIIGTWAFLIVFDIIVLCFGDSISEFQRDTVGVDNIWVNVYYTCVLPGHWWINLWDGKHWWISGFSVKIIRYAALILLGVLALWLNLTILKDILIPWYITVPGGLITGAILWPQAKKQNTKLKSFPSLFKKNG